MANKQYTGVTVKLGYCAQFSCERSDLVAVDAREMEVLVVCKDQSRVIKTRTARDARDVSDFLNEQLERQNGE